MTKTVTATGFSSVHIARLREKLGEWGNPSDSSEGNRDFIDLWFVDTDVLYTYIELVPGNYVNSWPSLYALGKPEDAPSHGTQIDESAREVIDSIAIAVSYFLFGRFRETLGVQSRRFLLTPEHDRELDAMAIALSFEAQRNVPNLMSSLTAHYQGLAKAESVADTSKHISAIFSLLRENSPSGKVSRTLELRRRLLDTMQDTAFFPSDEPGAAFAFRSKANIFEVRVKELAREAFGIFLGSLIKLHPAVERYAFIKTAVFAFHDPNRRLREYVDHILFQAHEHLAVDDGKSQQRPDEFDESMLTYRAKIAAKEVSDVYAFARLVALAEFLNANHPQSGRYWRVNLLTGSNMQRALMEQWRQRNAAVGSVRLVHPLSAMGIDGFAQPDEGHSDQDTNEHHEAPGAYALRALKQKGSGDIDVENFLNDFKDLLSSTAVSCAPNRERWMRNLRMDLGGLDQHSRSVYLRSMRDAISRDFASTFAGLNIGSFNKKGQLPTVSLPALALPLDAQDPSQAQQFVMQLHGDSNETDRLIPPVSKLIKADPTGYSALLCIGLGYLAQGRSSLRLAEAVGNTAVAFATTDISKDGENDSYPQGNEAIYFTAFVSRMQVDGSAAMRSDAHAWLQRHRSLLNRALVILQEWGLTDIGQRRVATPTKSQANDTTLAQLVRVRYEAEVLAADVFGHLIDRLEITDSKLLVKPPVECLVVAKDLARQWSELKKLDLQPQYRADVTFIGAQLVAVTIQAWLCVLADDPGGHIKDHEKWITEWVKAEALINAAPGSMLVRVLIEIFNSRTRGGKPRKRDLMEANRHLSQMQFSSLDELRGPLFKRLLDDQETPVSILFRGIA